MPLRLLKLFLAFSAFVLAGVLSGCSTIHPRHTWPVFYDAEKGPEHLAIAREPLPMAGYTNGFPDWNWDLRALGTKITSAQVTELAALDGRRVMEVRLALRDMYYSDELMILQEVKPERFLPVYVQVYNQHMRVPSANKISNGKKKIIIETGMDYSGTGHFHNHYQIVLAPDHKPVVTGSFY